MSSAAILTQKGSNSPNTEFSARSARLLLALWFSGGESINRGELTRRIQSKQEKSKDCQKFFTELETGGAIKVTGNKVSLTEQGKGALGHQLSKTDLAIEGTIVGAWLAKALLKWMQESTTTPDARSTNGNGKAIAHAISSYEEFKKVALETFNHLNQAYNMGNMVPIYRIRRELDDRVSRSQFNEWLFSLQSEDLLQLLEESVEDSAPDKIEDSVTTKLGKLRCYAKR